jgi:hypothetical protein
VFCVVFRQLPIKQAEVVTWWSWKVNISSDITCNNGSLCRGYHKSHKNIGCILGRNFLQLRHWINRWPSKFSRWLRRCFLELENENFRARFTCEDDRHSPGQETSRPLLDQKIEGMFATAATRTQFTPRNPVFNVSFNVILPCALNISKLISSLQVSNPNYNYTFLTSSVDATCHIHLTAVDLNTLLLFGDEYKSRNLLCNCLLPVTSFPPGPNIFPSLVLWHCNSKTFS